MLFIGFRNFSSIPTLLRIFIRVGFCILLDASSIYLDDGGFFFLHYPVNVVNYIDEFSNFSPAFTFMGSQGFFTWFLPQDSWTSSMVPQGFNHECSKSLGPRLHGFLQASLRSLKC